MTASRKNLNRTACSTVRSVNSLKIVITPLFQAYTESVRAAGTTGGGCQTDRSTTGRWPEDGGTGQDQADGLMDQNTMDYLRYFSLPPVYVYTLFLA
jgi:hypothetical protein